MNSKPSNPFHIALPVFTDVPVFFGGSVERKFERCRQRKNSDARHGRLSTLTVAARRRARKHCLHAGRATWEGIMRCPAHLSISGHVTAAPSIIRPVNNVAANWPRPLLDDCCGDATCRRQSRRCARIKNVVGLPAYTCRHKRRLFIFLAASRSEAPH